MRMAVMTSHMDIKRRENQILSALLQLYQRESFNNDAALRHRIAS